MRIFPVIKAVDISEKNIGSGSVEWTGDAGWYNRVSMQVVAAGYTALTVKLQGSLDGTNFNDIASFTLSASGHYIAQIGPFEKIRVHCTGTLSAGADSLKVYIKGSGF